MLDLHEVSKARDLTFNLTAIAQSRIWLLFWGQRNGASQCEGCAVLVVPLKKEITMKKVNSLTLSSMIQDCYRYCTARTQQAQSPSDDFRKGAIAGLFHVLVKVPKETMA